MDTMELTVFLSLYLFALLFLVRFAIRNKQKADQSREYIVYLKVIRAGKWENRELLSSSLLAIYLPYVIYRLCGGDKSIIFKLTPCFFYALMPPFCFLIAHIYLDIWYSILSSLFICSHFYFLRFPNLGRVSIAWGLFAGVIWGLLSGNIIVSAILAILLVVAHYGLTFHMLYILGCVWAVLFFARDTSPVFTDLSCVLVVLIFSLWVWMNFFATKANKAVISFMRGTATGKGPHASKRSPEIHAAFGAGFGRLSIPRKVEFFTGWILVGVLSIGVVVFLLGDFWIFDKLLVGASYSSILLTVAIPHLGMFHGIVKTYFTSLIILAPCFILGAKWITGLVGVSGYALVIPLIAIYALCMSGVLHRMFGEKK